MIHKPELWWPGVDQLNECARGLVWAAIMGEGAGGTLNTLPCPTLATFGSGAASPTWARCPDGRCLTFDGGDYADSGLEHVGKTGLFCQAGEQFTVLVRYANTASGTAIARAGGTAANRTFQIYVGAATQDPTTILRGTITHQDWDHFATGQWHTLIFTWDGAVATLADDLGNLANPAVGAAAEETGQRIIIGARTNGTGYQWNGSIALAMIWDRALGVSEWAALFADPYTPLRRPRSWCLPWSKFERDGHINLHVQRYPGVGLEQWVFNWQSDRDGNAELWLGDGHRPELQGWLDRVEMIPHGDDVPTADYDVRLYDHMGSDLLQDLGADRSATTEETEGIYDSLDSTGHSWVYASSITRLSIENAGRFKRGTVVLLVRVQGSSGELGALQS